MDKMLLQTAIHAITAEIAQDPNNATLFRERGRLYHQLGNQPAAMADLRTALRLDPSLVDDLANGQFQGTI